MKWSSGLEFYSAVVLFVEGAGKVSSSSSEACLQGSEVSSEQAAGRLKVFKSFMVLSAFWEM